MVRDITDISHPRTVATLNVPAFDPRFVSASDVSWIWADQASNLFRSSFAPGATVLVAACAFFFDWSPDGTTPVYIGGETASELHLLSGGRDRILASVPPLPAIGCESQSCADSWQFRLAYSPDASMISLVESYGETVFRIWTAEGSLLANLDSPSPRTMAVWSGRNLYFRDGNGVEVWHAGSVSLVLPGVAWINPMASPAGGKIVYTIRDSSGLPHVNVLDTTSGQTRELVSSRDAPAFLTPRFVWYEGVRLCTPGQCLGPAIATGKTYIYDLAAGTETESIITRVADVWPHPA